jgi:hypothetical protein
MSEVSTVALAGNNSKNISLLVSFEEADKWLGAGLANDKTRDKLLGTAQDWAYRLCRASIVEYDGKVFWNDPDQALEVTQALLGPFYKSRDTRIAKVAKSNTVERERIRNRANNWIGCIRSNCARYALAERTEGKDGNIVWSNIPDEMFARVNSKGEQLLDSNENPLVDAEKDKALRNVQFTAMDKKERDESAVTAKKYGKLKVLSSLQEKAAKGQKSSLDVVAEKQIKPLAKRFYGEAKAHWGKFNHEQVIEITDLLLRAVKVAHGKDAAGYAAWFKALSEETEAPNVG